MGEPIRKLDLVTQAVLPLVYDDSLSYYEFLCKVMEKLNELIESDELQNKAIEDLNGEIEDWEASTDEKYEEFKEQIEELYADFTANFVNEYDESKTYYKGDYVYYDGKLYRCTATTTSGEWDSNDWLDVVLADDLKTMQDVFEDSMLGQWEDFLEEYIQTLGVVQSTGDSTVYVMSQKAVTDELGVKDEQIRNLYDILEGVAFEYENGTSPTYIQDVPENSTRYADIQMIGGKTVVFNQLIVNGNFVTNENWTSTNSSITVSNNIGHVAITSSLNSARIEKTTLSFISGHKYYYTLTITPPKNNSLLISTLRSSDNQAIYIKSVSMTASTPILIEDIYTPSADSQRFRLYYNRDLSLSVGDVTDFSNIMIIDLTQMFGLGNEPTIEEFKTMFDENYYMDTDGIFINGKCSKVSSKDSNSIEIDSYNVPLYIKEMYGYGWSIGNIKNDVDYVNKKFIRRIERVDMGSLDWTYDTELLSVPVFVSQHLVSGKTGDVADFLSTKYIYVGGRSQLINYTKAIARYNNSSSANVVCVRDTAYTDATAFKTAMSGHYLYYELATPVETDLTQYMLTSTFINVENDGTLTFEQVDGTKLKLPNTVKYMTKI